MRIAPLIALVVLSPALSLTTALAGQTDPGEPNALSAIRSGYAEVGDDLLFFEEAGSGRTLLLLHDGLLHSITWDRHFQP